MFSKTQTPDINFGNFG